MSSERSNSLNIYVSFPLPLALKLPLLLLSLFFSFPLGLIYFFILALGRLVAIRFPLLSSSPDPDACARQICASHCRLRVFCIFHRFSPLTSPNAHIWCVALLRLFVRRTLHWLVHQFVFATLAPQIYCKNHSKTRSTAVALLTIEEDCRPVVRSGLASSKRARTLLAAVATVPVSRSLMTRPHLEHSSHTQITPQRSTLDLSRATEPRGIRMRVCN
jgi:hypothetical protein